MHMLIQLVSILGYATFGSYEIPSQTNRVAYVAAADTSHIPQALIRQPNTVAKAQQDREDWLAQQESSGHTPANTQHQLFIITASIVLFGALAVALWRRRDLKAFWQQDPQVEKIAVLATMPLGPKHRLLLVEACGEKLLLSMNDKDVSLLSQLGQTAQISGDVHQDMGFVPPETQVQAMLAEDRWDKEEDTHLNQQNNPYLDFDADADAVEGGYGSSVSAARHVSAEALYEGAAKAQEQKEAQQVTRQTATDTPKAKSSKSRSSKSKKAAMASDVAGLEHWREAAASGQGQESWGKPL